MLDEAELGERSGENMKMLPLLVASLRSLNFSGDNYDGPETPTSGPSLWLAVLTHAIHSAEGVR
jgi:hypothetical protein